LFIYKSAASTDGLKYISLNSHVNLGTPSLATSYYAKTSYTDSAGTTKGAAIVLCITIPLSAVNTAEAIQFVQYLVQNAKSLSTFGLVPLTPTLLYENTAPPATSPRSRPSLLRPRPSAKSGRIQRQRPTVDRALPGLIRLRCDSGRCS